MTRNKLFARMLASMVDSDPEVLIRVKRPDGSTYEANIKNVYFGVKHGEKRVILEMSEPPEMVWLPGSLDEE